MSPGRTAGLPVEEQVHLGGYTGRCVHVQVQSPCAKKLLQPGAYFRESSRYGSPTAHHPPSMIHNAHQQHRAFLIITSIGSLSVHFISTLYDSSVKSNTAWQSPSYCACMPCRIRYRGNRGSQISQINPEPIYHYCMSQGKLQQYSLGASQAHQHSATSITLIRHPCRLHHQQCRLLSITHPAA